MMTNMKAGETRKFVFYNKIKIDKSKEYLNVISVGIVCHLRCQLSCTGGESCVLLLRQNKDKSEDYPTAISVGIKLSLTMTNMKAGGEA